MVEQLCNVAAYPHSVHGKIIVHETHISWVFLAGKFAYKVKKPIVTDFLDYGSLEKRHDACCEELRLNSRYAEGIYLDVVPITAEDGQARMDGDAQPVEFALRMRRFDEGALLSDRLAAGQVSIDHLVQLGKCIATFHRRAPRTRRAEEVVMEEIYKQALANFEYLLMQPELMQDSMIAQLADWTKQTFVELESLARQRVKEGFIRECHGDLHCENIVWWQNHFLPFDGIEFNSHLSWIDVLSDVSFLVMDLQRLGRGELSACFLNAYLEQSGDYDALGLLRWYVVYRAIVRAKVAWIRAKQTASQPEQSFKHTQMTQDFLSIAYETTKPALRHLWITHGVSGSGKTTGSLQVVQSHNAIRLRSDVERKRLFGTSQAERQVPSYGQGVYAKTASETVYQSLKIKARNILHAGLPVIVDAAFLRCADRQQFRALANEEQVDFQILRFDADIATLRQRICDRNLANNDESDADISVLERQLSDREPLTADELNVCVDKPNS